MSKTNQANLNIDYNSQFPVDWKEGKKNTGDYKPLIRMIEKFEKTALQLSWQIVNQGMLEKNHEKIKDGAHKLKGSSAYIAAMEFQALCDKLQNPLKQRILVQKEIKGEQENDPNYKPTEQQIEQSTFTNYDMYEAFNSYFQVVFSCINLRKYLINIFKQVTDLSHMSTEVKKLWGDYINFCKLHDYKVIGINEKIKDYMVNPNTCAYKVNGEYIIDNLEDFLKGNTVDQSMVNSSHFQSPRNQQQQLLTNRTNVNQSMLNKSVVEQEIINNQQPQVKLEGNEKPAENCKCCQIF